MNIDPTLLLVATLAFFVGGVLKGAMGFGLPMIAIPLMTIVGSLPLALSIAGPPVVATNLWQLWKYRHHRKLPFLRWFLVPGAVGLLIGAFLLKYIEDAYLEIMLGCLVLLYLLIQNRKGSTTLTLRQRNLFAPSSAVSLVWFMEQPAYLVWSAHPIFMQRAWHAQAFIFSNSIMFTLFSMLHVPALGAVGLYQTSAVLIGAIAMVPAFAGLWLGSLLGEKLKADTFSWLVQAVLAGAAILPIWNGFTQLLAK